VRLQPHLGSRPRRWETPKNTSPGNIRYVYCRRYRELCGNIPHGVVNLLCRAYILGQYPRWAYILGQCSGVYLVQSSHEGPLPPSSEKKGTSIENVETADTSVCTFLRDQWVVLPERAYLTKKINYRILESQRSHKIVKLRPSKNLQTIS